MRITEIYKKTDYVRCPDGQRHEWVFAGGVATERKTNRGVEKHKCKECGCTKQVFSDSGKRVNR